MKGRCDFCGAPVRGEARTCSGHSDLRQYDAIELGQRTSSPTPALIAKQRRRRKAA